MLEQNCISESPAKSTSQLEKHGRSDDTEVFKIDYAMQGDNGNGMYQKRHDQSIEETHEVSKAGPFPSNSRGKIGDTDLQERTSRTPNSSAKDYEKVKR